MKGLLALCVVGLALAHASLLACNPDMMVDVDPQFNARASSKWEEIKPDLEFFQLRLSRAQREVPTPSGTGQGIVVGVSTAEELLWAMRSIGLLRQKSSMPIEIFHKALPQHVLDRAMELLRTTDVRFVNAEATRTFTMAPGARSLPLGLQLYAVHHSSFSQVLYLDPATTLLTTPESLFARLATADTAAILFSSGYKPHPANPVFDLLSIPCMDSYTQDATIFVVDKVKAASAFEVAEILTSSVFYQAMIDGNQDVLRLAFEARDVDYELVNAATSLYSLNSVDGLRSCACLRGFSTETEVVALFSINGPVANWETSTTLQCLESSGVVALESALPGTYEALVAAEQAYTLDTGICQRYSPETLMTYIRATDSHYNLEYYPKQNLPVMPGDRWILPVCGWSICGGGYDVENVYTRFFNFSTIRPRVLDVGAINTYMNYANYTIVQVSAPSQYWRTDCQANNRPEGTIVSGFYMEPHSWVVVSIAWDPYAEPMLHSEAKVLSYTSQPV